jgi:hypothetical protein
MSNLLEFDRSVTPAEDSTLISNCPNGITWEELAGFNWGTSRHEEVNRMLVETVGCKQIDAVNAGQSAISPTRGIAGAQLRIPKIFTRPNLPSSRRILSP